MRLFFIVSGLFVNGKGGAEKVAVELANEMHTRGHHIAICGDSAQADNNSSPMYPLNAEITIFRMRLDHKNARDELQNSIKEYDPDVCFVFYEGKKTLTSIASISKALNIPYAYQECTNPIRIIANIAKFQKTSIKKAHLIRQSLFSGAARVRLTMTSFIDYSPMIAKKNCVAFPNAFKQKGKAGTQQRTKHSTTKKQIINIGGLKSENKNGITLFNAFINLANDFPDWTLVYLGNVGKGIRKILLPLIEKHDLHDRVILTGPTDAVEDYYSTSDIHVICSYEEGCPNAVCEAMCHQLPSIGFKDCLGTNELIKNNINGLLIERTSNQASSLEKNLRLLMEDSSLRNRLARQAFIDAKKFHPSKIYDQWEQLFIEAASYKRNVGAIFKNQLEIDTKKAQLYKSIREQLTT